MFMHVMTHSTDGDDSNTKYNTFQVRKCVVKRVLRICM